MILYTCILPLMFHLMEVENYFLAKTIWNMKKKNMFDLKISKFIQQVLRWKTLVSWKTQ